MHWFCLRLNVHAGKKCLSEFSLIACKSLWTVFSIFFFIHMTESRAALKFGCGKAGRGKYGYTLDVELQTTKASLGTATLHHTF